MTHMITWQTRVHVHQSTTHTQEHAHKHNASWNIWSHIPLAIDSSGYNTSSRPWGFEFLHAYISLEQCWLYYGLRHNSTCLVWDSRSSVWNQASLRSLCIDTSVYCWFIMYSDMGFGDPQLENQDHENWPYYSYRRFTLLVGALLVWIWSNYIFLLTIWAWLVLICLDSTLFGMTFLKFKPTNHNIYNSL